MNISSILSSIQARIKKNRSIKSQIAKIEKLRTGGAYATLTKEQEQEVQSFYKKYTGEETSLLWHEYYYYANGEFSPKYLTTLVYYRDINHKLNNKHFVGSYSDKNMIHKLLGGRVKTPKTYVNNINGVYFSNERIISKEEAISLCRNIEDGIIKTSIDSKQGKSILRFSSINGSVVGKNCPSTIEELLDLYSSNFIVQAAIKQSKTMALLNPTSLNTIRVMTYWSQNDGIVPLYEIVRMGRSGAVVDNASSGGLYCGVEHDGKLKEYAYTLYPYSKHTQSDTGVIFKSFQIPKFKELLEKAVELHEQLPYARIIGWDFSIDEDEEIELVEINAREPGIFQVATGPAFGKYTEEVLEFCLKKHVVK